VAAYGSGLLAAPPKLASPGFVFWTQSAHGGEDERGSIGRAELDSSPARGHFIAAARAPAGIAVGHGYLFWANHGSFTIGRAKLDGSDVENQFVKDVYSTGVAVEGGYVYWTNAGLDPARGTIGRSRLNGSGVKRRYIKVGGAPTGLAIDARHIYWTYRYWNRNETVSHYAIGRANLDGSGVTRRFIKAVNKIDGVAVNARYIFWSSNGEHTIGRANLDGTAVAQRCFPTGRSPLENVPEGLAVDNEHVYWTNYPADTIARTRLDGSQRNDRFIKVVGVPEGVVAGAGQGAQSPAPAGGNCVGPSSPPILFGSTDYRAGPYGSGWGEVAPRTISNGGASASGTIYEIHWRSWGGRVAVGRGRHPTFKPHGGYYRRPVVIKLRASRIKRCKRHSRLVYTRFTVREQVKPGGRFGKWFAWDRNMCNGYKR
jgi:virginiamycin B lyase